MFPTGFLPAVSAMKFWCWTRADSCSAATMRSCIRTRRVAIASYGTHRRSCIRTKKSARRYRQFDGILPALSNKIGQIGFRAGTQSAAKRKKNDFCDSCMISCVPVWKSLMGRFRIKAVLSSLYWMSHIPHQCCKNIHHLKNQGQYFERWFAIFASIRLPLRAFANPSIPAISYACSISRPTACR